MSKVYDLFDNKTDRKVFSGTEPECIKYSVEHPDVKFYWVTKQDWEVKNVKDSQEG